MWTKNEIKPRHIKENGWGVCGCRVGKATFNTNFKGTWWCEITMRIKKIFGWFIKIFSRKSHCIVSNFFCSISLHKGIDKRQQLVFRTINGWSVYTSRSCWCHNVNQQAFKAGGERMVGQIWNVFMSWGSIWKWEPKVQEYIYRLWS